MTIDERLEALTHSVELLAQMQLKTEKEIRGLGKYIRVVAEMVSDRKGRLSGLEGGEENEEAEE